MGGVGTRILSVEDDERIRTAVKLALEDEGWTVDEAGSFASWSTRWVETFSIAAASLVPTIRGKLLRSNITVERYGSD